MFPNDGKFGIGAAQCAPVDSIETDDGVQIKTVTGFNGEIVHAKPYRKM